MTREALKIIVTGEHEDMESRVPNLANGHRLEWVQLPLLRFERLPLAESLFERLATRPVNWIIFSSQRGVRFWSEALMEAGIDFPLETQVACIGEQTAVAAGNDGFTADFYPTEPGTEKFLEEFADLLSNSSEKPEIFIPMAEGGRTALAEGLRALGCKVEIATLYRTLPLDNLDGTVSSEDLQRAALVLFTSPSSIDAFLKHFPLPPEQKTASIGRFTAEHLRKLGVASPKVLPEGDFKRIGEIL